MKKILIIEDEVTLTQALKKKLDKKGYSILIASSGDWGLKVAFEEHPDLILLDLLIPNMDGMTMLRKLREDKWGKTVQVMILTNLSDELCESGALECGVYDYLIKSNWKLEDLVKRIEARMRKGDVSGKVSKFLSKKIF